MHFDKHMYSRNHHYSKIIEHFHHPKKDFLFPFIANCFSPFPSPWKPWIHFLWLYCFFLEFFANGVLWSGIFAICFFYLAKWFWDSLLLPESVVCFSLLSGISLYVHTTLCLYICQLIYIYFQFLAIMDMLYKHSCPVFLQDIFFIFPR